MVNTFNRIEIAFWDLAILLMSQSTFVQSVLRAADNLANSEKPNRKAWSLYLAVLAVVAAAGLMLGLTLSWLGGRP